MSQRLKLTVAYEGAAFAGWQSQAHRNAVQDKLEHAFQKISGTRIRVHGAGRTDAGVHALAQCAHVDLLKAAGEIFVGTHDFGAFAANRGKKANDTTRTIWSVRVRRSGPRVTIEIAGDGFLYKMVRLMVGAMTRVALNKMKADEITARLKSGRADGLRFVAPAEGLYLVKVWY